VNATRAILHLASEMAPLAKVGGLGDVVAALSAEQVRRGHRVVVALPHWRDLELPDGWTLTPLEGALVPWGMGHEPAKFTLAAPPEGGPTVLLVDHAGDRRFFHRPGIYDDPATHEGYPDNAERFLFFTRAALEAARRMPEPFAIVHAHDQQAAWAPCLLRTHAADVSAFAGTATVFTIHNLGYQGIVDPWVLGLAGFPRSTFFPGSPFEYHGRVNFMKVGILFADMVSTVSPTYAREIQMSGEYGFGLEGVLRRRTGDVRGILNGIDDREWDPATDRWLPAHFDRQHLAGKRACRNALVLACGFPLDPAWPIVGMVSRLASQKGCDLIETAERALCDLPARFAVLGVGEPRYMEFFRRLADERPWQWSHSTAHDEGLAHRIEAGSDLFLMPSRYEPCGLAQLIALRYGTVPVVRRTGGLADTVTEFDPARRTGTGFLFGEFSAEALLDAVRRAVAAFRRPEIWSALVKNAMTEDFSWDASAREYAQLYKKVLRPQGARPSRRSR
jgi:starch synthase